jgi:hypothetical protein
MATLTSATEASAAQVPAGDASQALASAPVGDGQSSDLPDFQSATYKDAYSRINAIVIEGEQEAHDNYIAIGTLIPDQAEELTRLAPVEMIGGYWREVGTSWKEGTTLERSNLA